MFDIHKISLLNHLVCFIGFLDEPVGFPAYDRIDSGSTFCCVLKDFKYLVKVIKI